LDGDEYLDETNRGRMRELIYHLPAENAGFLIGQRSKSPEGLAILVHQVRLFRNQPGIRWEYRVHEQILPTLQRCSYEIHRTGITITHTGYQDPMNHASKMQRNLRLLLLDKADRPDDPYTLFNLGVIYSKRGSHDAALEPLLRSLDTLPRDSDLRPKALAALIRSYHRLGRTEQASAVCTAGRRQFPEDLELLSLDGVLRREGGDEKGAETCWKQVLWSRPISPFASSSLSLLDDEQNMQGGFDETDHPKDLDEGLFPCAGHNLALMYRHQGRLADAEAQWFDVQQEYPRFLLAWVGLGELYLDQERWAELEQVAERMEDNPRMLSEALTLRGQARLAQQDFDQARNLVRSALARDPGFLKAKVILSHVLLQEGKELDGAEMVLREILQSDPENVQSWRNLMVFLRGQHRMTEAADLCRQARAHCPDDPDLLLLHGMLLQELGKGTEAEDCLLNLVENSFRSEADRQRSLMARHYLALTYRDRGWLPKAVDQWQDLLADAPYDLAAWMGLAETYLAMGDLEGCQEIARRLSWRPEWIFESKVLQARGNLARKHFFAARQLLEEVLVDYPSDERCLVLLSQALLQEGKNWTAAEQVLRRILKVTPNNAEAQHNLEVLLRCRDTTPA
jgi:tetratricopeptide (TPR) repeat protein